MVNPETLPIIESGVLKDNIPDFDWDGGHSGVVLNNGQAAALKRIFKKYMQNNEAIFTERLALIEKRNMENDQLYMDKEHLAEIQS